jgi:molecular chaperone GrpE
MVHEQEREPTAQTTEGQTESAEPTDLAQLRTALAEATQKSEEYLRLLQRVQADFINYRRRVEQEREDMLQAARAEAVLALLPVLDDLERALEAIAAHPWVEGIRLIHRNFLAVLERLGVTRIEALGRPFDPWEQEAVASEERADLPEGTVVGVVRHGYKLNGRVIRPALVRVARAPAAASSS